MLEAHGGRLGPLELMINSLSRAQSWKEAKHRSSESIFWPCPRWWAQSRLQLHCAFCTLKSSLWVLQVTGVGGELFLFVASVILEKNGLISFIMNLGLTRSFCFCLLSGGRTNPFQFQLFVLVFLFEDLWPPTVLPSQSVQRLEEWVSFWTAADWRTRPLNSSLVEGWSCYRKSVPLPLCGSSWWAKGLLPRDCGHSCVVLQ